jgi:sulfur relay (sulfurtransferase) DsrF/TusC family protein
LQIVNKFFDEIIFENLHGKMNKFELYDIDNCFVCAEAMGPFKNELTVVTGFSEKTIQEIIGKISFVIEPKF